MSGERIKPTTPPPGEYDPSWFRQLVQHLQERIEELETTQTAQAATLTDHEDRIDTLEGP